MNTIGARLRDLTNSELAQWRLTVPDITQMDAVAGSGRNLVSKHQIQSGLSVENEQADARRDGRTRLARPKWLGAIGGREIFIFTCSADHEQDSIGNPVDPHYSTV